MPKSVSVPQLNRLFDVEHLRSKVEPFEIEVTADERAALATRLGVDALPAYQIDIEATPWRGTGLKIMGRIHARVQQICVVSLESFEQKIEETIEIKYLPDVNIKKGKGDDVSLILDIDEWDEPEAIPEDGQIDLGEIATEFLVLAINPYPRKPEFVGQDNGYMDPSADVISMEEQSDEGKPKGPFSDLEKWKNRLK
jgi:hypothetical protein